jgi:hypothetical protein
MDLSSKLTMETRKNIGDGDGLSDESTSNQELHVPYEIVGQGRATTTCCNKTLAHLKLVQLCMQYPKHLF